jgi:hypothetical protein
VALDPWALTQGLSGRRRWVKGRQEKKTRETDVHLRQLAKQSTHVPTFFYLLIVGFSAFLGVSRQGEFRNTETKVEYVSNKIAGEIFSGGFFLSGSMCFTFFSFDFLLLRWLSASRQGEL